MYSTLMVPLEARLDNTHPLKVTEDIATRCGASAIAVAARRLLQVARSVPGLSGDIFERDRLKNDQGMDAAEREFHPAAGHRGHHPGWRPVVPLRRATGTLPRQER